METNFLGIDWGKEKIGVALAHRETGIAVAWNILPNDGELLSVLGALIQTENIGTVVIGVPVFRHEPTEKGWETLGLALASEFSVEVVYQNEMFTSKMAQQNLAETGKKNISSLDDMEAARILLQDWMDRQS